MADMDEKESRGFTVIDRRGSNREERREARETALTLNKFGRLMVTKYPRIDRNTGKGYAVQLRELR